MWQPWPPRLETPKPSPQEGAELATGRPLASLSAPTGAGGGGGGPGKSFLFMSDPNSCMALNRKDWTVNTFSILRRIQIIKICNVVYA